MTAVDLMTQPELVAKAKAELSAVANPDAKWRQMRFFT